MFISAHLRKSDGVYGGKAYHYRCSFDVAPGDIVIVETSRGLNYARVAETNIPRESIAPEWVDNLRDVVDTMEADTI